MNLPPGPESADWHADVSALVADGHDYLDLLTAVDRPGDHRIDVVVHLLRRSDGDGLFMHCRLDRRAPVLPSLSAVLPAAAWHEREMAEMFGVQVAGLAEPLPLLLGADAPTHPLRKDVYLAARGARPWPGAVPEAGGRARRGARAIGVPPEGVDPA